MKLKFLSAAFILLLGVSSVVANDGVFYASGNTLVPLQETEVRLRRELLKFTVVDHTFAEIEVEFEFFNPSRMKTVTVGFVTPPADGDVLDEDAKHPFISDFTVRVNGRIVPFKIKQMSETSFKLGEQPAEGRDFVYYFPVTFKKGVNKIRHTYRFRGGESVELQRYFDYQITTGKRWANRQIDNFELQIHLDRGIFAIPASFQSSGQLAAWQIVGDGIIEDQVRQWFGEESPKVRMAHLNAGYLSLKAENFKPDTDISFGEYNWAAGWASIWCDFAQECVEGATLEKIVRHFNLRPSDDYEKEDFADYGAKDFKYLRNYFYAVRGFAFKDPGLKRFYSQFFWYKPNPTVTIEKIRLSDAESVFLRKLKTFERIPKE